MNVHKHNVHVIYLQPLQLHTVRKLVLRASAGGHEQKKHKAHTRPWRSRDDLIQFIYRIDRTIDERSDIVACKIVVVNCKEEIRYLGQPLQPK